MRRSGLARIFNRSNWPLLGLILLVGLLLVVSALGSRPAQPIPFDLDSSAETGLRGLDLWLQELGYDVRRIGGMQFQLPADADLLFVYPNQLSYSEAEAEALHAWVAGGHTLVLVGPHPEDAQLERVFGVRSKPREGFGLVEHQAQPLVPEGESEYMTDWNVGSEALDLEKRTGCRTHAACRRWPGDCCCPAGGRRRRLAPDTWQRVCQSRSCRGKSWSAAAADLATCAPGRRDCV